MSKYKIEYSDTVTADSDAQAMRAFIKAAYLLMQAVHSESQNSVLRDAALTVLANHITIYDLEDDAE